MRNEKESHEHKEKATDESDSSVTFVVQRAQTNGCQCSQYKNGDLSFSSINARPFVKGESNMKTTNSIRIRISRFFGDRYAYRTQPGYSSELVAFGIIVFIAIWPVILLANAMSAAAR